MKILILSSGRSGSTSLMKGFKKSLKDSFSYFEPFSEVYPQPILSYEDYEYHKKFLNTLFTLKTNVIVKSLVFQPNSLNTNSIVSFYLDYFKIFDKIILLARKNSIETAQSFSICRKIGKDQWHKSYSISQNIDYSHDLEKVKLYNDNLNTLSKLSNIPLTYYEDIFSGNKDIINNFLDLNHIKVNNIDILNTVLNPKNRYKQN